MTISLRSELRLSFRESSKLRANAVGRLVIAIAFLLLPAISLAQTFPVPPPQSSAVPAATSAPAVSAPFSTGEVSAPSGYVLSPNDQVAVEVFGEDDLRTNGRLNGEGNLSVPLLGSVHLAGLTLTRAASKLTELYARDYLVNPKVNVTLVGYAKRRFTVLGQVNRPGSYEMPDGSPGGIDILEAIAMAGGYTRIAARERVSVRRQYPCSGDQLFKVNAKRLARGSDASFRVEPGDTITVGESIF
jgi:protein involved in polysaccharide export with SLBB domain